MRGEDGARRALASKRVGVGVGAGWVERGNSDGAGEVMRHFVCGDREREGDDCGLVASMLPVLPNPSI